MFCGCERLIGINGHLIHDLIDCGEVKDISCMFMNCKIIPTINLYLFKNLFRENKEMNMDNLFYGCEELIKIEGLDTNNATSVDNMFYGCKKYKILDINISINNNEKTENNKKEDMKDLLRKKKFKESFEKAIKTEDFDILYKVIRSYMLSLSKNELEIINFSKDNLKDLVKIISNGINDITNGILECDNLIPIIKFIKKIFVEKNDNDKELGNAINNLYNERDNLETYKIKFEEEELKEIVDFFKK